MNTKAYYKEMPVETLDYRSNGLLTRVQIRALVNEPFVVDFLGTARITDTIWVDANDVIVEVAE